mgnify:CR=1 FL=1
MSMWGMDDGSTLTGKHLWTNGDATVQDGGTGPNATYVTDGVEAGDVLVGFDGLLYRVVSVTSETALEVDRNYEGGTADSKDITKIKLPRHLKITKDDGTGHSLQTLGVFGITKGEADAGVDNLSAIGLSGTSSIGRAFQSGTAHRSVPTVTVAAPPTNTIATAKVNTTDNTIEITDHGFRTGTKLTYLSSSGAVITGLTNNTSYFVISKETTDSGTTFGDLTANTFALASSLSNSQAGTAIGLTGTGHAAQTLIGDTATATAVLGSGTTLGEVIRVDIAGAGSAYTSAPTVTIAAPTTETVDLSDGTKLVDAENEVVSQTTNSWSQYQSSESVLIATEAQLKAAEIANEGITLEYDSGNTRTTLEVIQSRSLLLNARIAFAKAERDFMISKFELAFQLGTLSLSSIKSL